MFVEHLHRPTALLSGGEVTRARRYSPVRRNRTQPPSAADRHHLRAPASNPASHPNLGASRRHARSRRGWAAFEDRDGGKDRGRRSPERARAERVVGACNVACCNVQRAGGYRLSVSPDIFHGSIFAIKTWRWLQGRPRGNAPTLQAKRQIGTVDDPLELEARKLTYPVETGSGNPQAGPA